MSFNTIDICKELGQNFIDFSYETNSCRAFADARDGLKPGQRACLWEMFTKGFTAAKAHVKSAKIAGGVVGTWWPHGDTAIYDTFTRMSQKWVNNMPEVDWHGNNGSQVVPDAAAASRYTEARLSKVAEEGLFGGIKKKNVSMIPNYSEDEEWPEVLPAILPRLMVNGCQGIGSTIANVWLPHNLQEVAEVIIHYMRTGDLDYSNLYPDFPVGCEIINKKDIPIIYKTGKGKVVLRARAEVKNNHIYFRELTYQTYVEPLIEKIKDLILSEELKGIDSIYNRSSKKGIEIDIECTDNPYVVLNRLYSKTDLQKSYNANQWALVGKTPRLLTLQDYCDIYLSHNEECLIRETNFDKAKAEARKEVVDGLLRALEDIDNIIALIKKSKSSADAKERLIAQYSFTENQAKAIVGMKLGSLAGLEKIELQEEDKELLSAIARFNNILASEDLRKDIIKERLETIVKKYGGKRRTELTQIETKPLNDNKIEIIPEDIVVTVTKNGLISRIPANSIKKQRRGGKGVKNDSNAALITVKTNTADAFLLFTNSGKMYKTMADNIPEGKPVPINSVVKMKDNETVISATSLKLDNPPKYAIFITKNGMVKKTPLIEYTRAKKTTGIVALKIRDGDSVVDVLFQNEEEILLITKLGMSIRFETNSIAAIGRTSMGVRGIKLKENDEVVAGIVITPDVKYIALCADRGVGKRVAIDDFPYQCRDGKGLIAFPETNGFITGAVGVNDKGSLLIVGDKSTICIDVSELPILGRTSIGNILIKDNKITSIALL